VQDVESEGILNEQEAEKTMKNIMYATVIGASVEVSAEERRRFDNWIKFNPAEFTLVPFGVTTINYVANVPKDAIGGHYAVMFFETLASSPQQNALGETVESGVGLAIRIGSLFYIEAKNTIKRSADLTNFAITKDSDKSYTFQIDFKNTGNTDITSSATFNLTDKKGKVYARGPFKDLFTFPGNITRLTAVWKDALAAGNYDFVLTLNLGKAQEEYNLGRGPVLVLESAVEIGENGEVLKVGELK